MFSRAYDEKYNAPITMMITTNCANTLKRMNVCDRFGLLHRGNLMYNGSLDEIRQKTGRKHLTDMFLKMMHESENTATPNPAEVVS